MSESIMEQYFTSSQINFINLSILKFYLNDYLLRITETFILFIIHHC